MQKKDGHVRNTLLAFIILVTTILCGCQTTSNDFLSFPKNTTAVEYQADNLIADNDFFAENIAVVGEDFRDGEESDFKAAAALLVNATEDEVIYADHIYDRLYPASLTKLLTALVVLRNGELTDSVTISYNASHIPVAGAKLCGFKEGDVISLDALLYSLLIYSGNDAGIAIAEHISGSEEVFAEKMNEEARRIGAVHTHFVNSHGLHDDNHYTTAYDLYLIFNELLQYDTFQTIISTDSYTAIYTDKAGNKKEKTFQTTNQYLTGIAEPVEGISVIGGKTGTTRKAGNCLMLLSQDDNDTRYISLLLKTPNVNQLYTEMSDLLSLVNNKQ